jgi:branched-chain amino acid transport system ATP-binding protein
VLEVAELSVAFGGVRALTDVSFTVEQGRFLGVIGPNGCGKSTLLNAITGVVPSRGTVRLDGELVPRERPIAANRVGVARVFQAPQMFAALTVLENVAVGCRPHRRIGVLRSLIGRRSMWRDERLRWAAAEEALARVGLGGLGAADVEGLSYGRQRLVELARCLAARPRVLLLDEPSAGLNDHETDVLVALLQGLHADGLTVVMVDHKIDVVDRLCERVMVMETGCRIAEGTPEQIWADPRVVDAYLGVAGDARGA